MKLNRLDAELWLESVPFIFPLGCPPPQLCVCGPTGHSRSLSKELKKKRYQYTEICMRFKVTVCQSKQKWDISVWGQACFCRFGPQRARAVDKCFLTFNPSHKQDNPRCDTVSSLYYSKWVHIVRTQNRDRLVCFSLPLPPALRLSGLRARVTLK